MRAPVIRLAVVFLRRLALPLVLFAAFNALSVVVYTRLEGLRWLDALFWITHLHAIELNAVREATKLFALLVYTGVFAFQIWIAERILVTIFSRQGVEAWRSMINDVNLSSVRDHFIICGYGQVGRTVVEQLNRLHLPFILVETNEGLYRELLHEGILVVHGDAKQHDSLRAAGIERARGICIVIDNDADNPAEGGGDRGARVDMRAIALIAILGLNPREFRAMGEQWLLLRARPAPQVPSRQLAA
jgi:voltage-gated potassium channel